MLPLVCLRRYYGLLPVQSQRKCLEQVENIGSLPNVKRVRKEEEQVEQPRNQVASGEYGKKKLDLW